MSPHLPGERDPAQVQAERGTPGQCLTLGSDAASRRSVAKDALTMMAWADTEPQPDYP